MRLCWISKTHPLSEAISRTDFFDLYSLIAAHQDKHYESDPQTAREIRHRLEYEVRYVLQDQLDQLFQIIANRLYEDNPTPAWGEAITLRPFYEQWGIKIIPSPYGGGCTQPDRDSLLAMSLPRRAEFLQALNRRRQELGTTQWFTSTDGTWSKLAAKYGELVHGGQSLPAMIRTVDRIYGLCHHGGMLADYFDERQWLEDALHTRSVGDPGQLLRHASSDVRALVGTALNGVGTRGVTELQKLRLAVNKALGGMGDCVPHGDGLLVSCKPLVWFTTFILPADEHGSPEHRTNILQITRGQRPRGSAAGPDEPEPQDQYQRSTKLLGAPQVTLTVRFVGPELVVVLNGRTITGKDMGMVRRSKLDDYARPSKMADHIMDLIRQEALAQFWDVVPAGTMSLGG